MTDIPKLVKQLRELHDRLQLNVVADGFKTLQDREADCAAAMDGCWKAAAALEGLQGEVKDLQADLDYICAALVEMNNG